MANNFVDGISKQEYLFKLIPDLSIFDVVERYFIDNNKNSGIDGLFFYSNSEESIGNIPFRRLIVKSNGTISTTPVSNEDSNFLNHTFSINEDNYLIIIDEQNKAGESGFTVTRTGGDYLIGVCF